HAGASGPRASALDTAKELARQNVSRQAAAVQGHEAAILAVPARMDRPGKHFLADPGLTLQQHRRIEARQLPRLLDGLPQSPAAADDLATTRLVPARERRASGMDSPPAGSPLGRARAHDDPPTP